MRNISDESSYYRVMLIFGSIASAILYVMSGGPTFVILVTLPILAVLVLAWGISSIIQWRRQRNGTESPRRGFEVVVRDNGKDTTP